MPLKIPLRLRMAASPFEVYHATIAHISVQPHQKLYDRFDVPSRSDT